MALWKKRIGDVHLQNRNETLCGRPMLGNNYSTKDDVVDCLECLTKVEGKESYDFVNPKHYVKDGRQTWERMVDIWGVAATALWCEMTAFKYEDCRIENGKPGEERDRELAKIEWYKNKAKELRDGNR